MTLCLVTDRRRLVAPGASEGEACRCLLAQARHAADAGVDLIQVRERDLDAAALATLVTSVIDAVEGTATRVVVNERLDVAVWCGAYGVHLRGDSIPVAAARRLAPPAFVIGRSVHSIDETHAASGADYLIAGTVFPSESKHGSHALLGISGLTACVGGARAGDWGRDGRAPGRGGRQRGGRRGGHRPVRAPRARGDRHVPRGGARRRGRAGAPDV